MINVYTAYRNAVYELNNSGVESAEFDAQALIEKSFGLNKTQLLMNTNMPADEDSLRRFRDFVERRCAGEPLQYIIGEWGFYDLNFNVGKGVLIPRPETEILAELAIDFVNKTQAKTVFDLCTGSGCVGLTIASHCPSCRVYCVDFSEDALYYARMNMKKNRIYNAEIIQGDIRRGFKFFNLPAPDIIVSNPPYIPTYEIPALQREVLQEPKDALDGGIDGLDFYSVLSASWFPYIAQNGILAMECGENQATSVLRFFLNSASKAKIIKDANGTERTVVIKK